MNCSLLGSSVHGIFQARVLEWVAIAFSKRWHTICLNSRFWKLFHPKAHVAQSYVQWECRLLVAMLAEQSLVPLWICEGFCFQQAIIFCLSQIVHPNKQGKKEIDYVFIKHFHMLWASPVPQTVKDLPVIQETQVQSLGGKIPPEKGVAIHSSILA